MWPEFVLHQAGGSHAPRSQRGSAEFLTKSEALGSSPEHGGDPFGFWPWFSLRTRPPSALRTHRTAPDGWDPTLGVLTLPASEGEPGYDEYVGCETRRSRDPPSDGTGGSSGTAVPATQTFSREIRLRLPVRASTVGASYRGLLLAARGETREASRIAALFHRPSPVSRR